MKEKDYNTFSEHRNVSYSKSDVIKLDTKCLYAGKLERIKQWNEKSHSHPFCEIMFVVSGAGKTVIDGNEYDIKKGDIIVYNPNTTHEESTTGSSGLELAFFGITNFKINSLPSDSLIDKHASPILQTGEDEERFNFYFTSLIDEVYENKQYSDLIIKYWARLILIGILRLTNTSEAKFVTNAIFTQIYQYLNTNFTKIESMDQICEDLNVSKYYISHVFKKYIGKPPMQYITSKRIDYAKKLLQETDISACEIGEMCGYKDHTLFFKAFKKLVGTTPIAFRRENTPLA